MTISNKTCKQFIANNQTTKSSSNEDPFAAQREADATIDQSLDDVAGDQDMAMPGSPTNDRRMSKEWDASKVRTILRNSLFAFLFQIGLLFV
jgi:hypothetical protein